METDDAAAEKRTAVDYLSFGAKTARRVAWESWSFTIVGPHQVEVCNESYGFLKDDHAYTVSVEVGDGLTFPAECGCPADMYRDDYDCKHKVALATVGGPTVLNAAVEIESPATMTDERLKADGGAFSLELDSDTESCPNGDPRCDGPHGDTLPCFACFEPSEGC